MQMIVSHMAAISSQIAPQNQSSTKDRKTLSNTKVQPSAVDDDLDATEEANKTESDSDDETDEDGNDDHEEQIEDKGVVENLSSVPVTSES